MLFSHSYGSNISPSAFSTVRSHTSWACALASRCTLQRTTFHSHYLSGMCAPITERAVHAKCCSCIWRGSWHLAYNVARSKWCKCSAARNQVKLGGNITGRCRAVSHPSWLSKLPVSFLLIGTVFCCTALHRRQSIYYVNVWCYLNAKKTFRT